MYTNTIEQRLEKWKENETGRETSFLKMMTQIIPESFSRTDDVNDCKETQ